MSGPTFGGGAEAPKPSPTPAFVPTPAPVPAPAGPSVNDGYGGGAQFTRDTTGLSGGTPGNVNVVLYSHTVAGKDVKAFEWNALMLLDNYADAGENCGAYIQANKHGAGATWGLCVEACDTTPGDATGLVTLELDQWVSGPDNGERFGIDLVVGDSRTKRGLSASDAVEATAAIRVSNSNVDPHAKWGTGVQITGNVDTGVDTRKSNAKVALQAGVTQGIKAGPFNLLYLSLAAFACSAGSLALAYLK